MSRWKLSSDAQRDLVQQREIARIQADVDFALAKGKNADIVDLVRTLRVDLPNATDSEILAKAEQMYQSRNIKDMQNLTVLAMNSDLAISSQTPAKGGTPNTPKKGGKK